MNCCTWICYIFTWKGASFARWYSKFFWGRYYKKKGGNNLIKCQVRSITDLAIVIAHSEKYPLITQKWADYQLFKQAFEIVNRKEHLSFSGLEKILSLRASINSPTQSEARAG